MMNYTPFVRYARKNEQRIFPGWVRAVDHRLFYCHSGCAICEISSEIYHLKQGTVIYIPAGFSYSIRFEGEMPVLSGCNFDFFQDHSHLAEPIPPISAADFRLEDILEKQIFHQDHIFSRAVCLDNAFSLEHKLLEIAGEFQLHSLYSDCYCSALMNVVLIRIAQLWQAQSMGIDQQKSNAILNFVHANYGLPLTNRMIAAHFGYHENYISSLVRKYTGIPLHRYLLRYRMHVAVSLLQTTELSVSEVAAQVAMPDIKHFSKCFKKVMGVPPSHFRSAIG